jgi:hypothetical protein
MPPAGRGFAPAPHQGQRPWTGFTGWEVREGAAQRVATVRLPPP